MDLIEPGDPSNTEDNLPESTPAPPDRPDRVDRLSQSPPRRPVRDRRPPRDLGINMDCLY